MFLGTVYHHLFNNLHHMLVVISPALHLLCYSNLYKGFFFKVKKINNESQVVILTKLIIIETVKTTGNLCFRLLINKKMNQNRKKFFLL